MASTTKYAGSGVTGSISSFTGEAWTSPGNITSSDNSYTSVVLGSTKLTSETLQATNFAFALSPFSTINGIVVGFERKASTLNTIRDNHIYLIKSGSLLGNNKVGAPDYWSTTEGVVSFGSPTDLWGATLGASDINDSTFGVMIDAQWYSAYSNDETAYVDSIEMTVYYDSYVCGWGGTSIKDIYWGSTKITNIYHGTTRVY